LEGTFGDLGGGGLRKSVSLDEFEIEFIVGSHAADL
jgi:hypothetical protein